MSNTNTNLQTQTSSVLHNDTVSSCSTSKVQEKTQLSRSRCMNSLREVKSQFKFLSETLQDFELNCKHYFHKTLNTFVNAFNSEFKERIQKYTRFDDQSFKDSMIRHMDFIEKYMLRGHSSSTRDSIIFTDSQFSLDYDSQMIDKYFVEYTGIEVKHFRDTLLQHMGNVKKSVAERTRHQRQYERRVNKRQMQTQESKIDTGKAVDADLVVTESSGTKSEVHDDSSRSGNDTNTDDADIRPIYDEEPMAEVQLTAECNIFAIGQQHTEQRIPVNER
ncbi:hypothetical protein Tco_1018115 [Tanacetum coccineum]|uniref:Uncharacterized protein n=1 Tax=Tanacetum coccineum TaxID=301880 RepID=A0ABQ5FTE8_9ASTR